MAFRDPAAIPLTVHSYRTCAAKLAPGEVKRIPQRSAPLIGYQIACPSCGARCPYQDKNLVFIEDPPKDVPVRDTQVRRRLIDTELSYPCYGCKLYLFVRGGVLHAALEPDVDRPHRGS